jgi:tetratricopeptide (TPR) repeat protein
MTALSDDTVAATAVDADTEFDRVLRGVAHAPAVDLGGWSDARIPAGTIVDETFEIGGVLGIGGMGIVYEATDLRLDRRVADAIREGWEPDSLKAGQAELNLAAALATTGHTAAALPLYEQARSTISAPLGPTHPHMILVDLNLSRTLADLGRWAEADERLARAEAAAQAGMPTDDIVFGRIESGRAEILAGQGRLDEAIAAGRRAVAACERADARQAAGE